MAFTPPLSSTARAVQLACGGWSVVSSPNEGDVGRLFAVDAASAHDVWAVGESQFRAALRGLTEHWDGSIWDIVPSVNPGGGSELTGVAVVASSDVWAVGFTYSTSKDKSFYKTFTEHWDGSSWSRVASPSRLGVHNYLTSVTAISTDDVWAVGYTWAAHTSYQKTLIEHWDGTAWSILTSPNPGQKLVYNQLLSVHGLAADDLWAVGFYDGPGQVENLPLTEHWDGSSWTLVDAPSADANTVLHSVAVIGASDVWAVGESYVINAGPTLVEHWNGSAWSIVPSPSVGSMSVLQAVVANGPGDVWALGGSAEVGIFPGDTLAEHWNGVSWSVAPTPPSPDSNDYFNGAAIVSSTEVWGVGIAQPLNDLTLTEHFCP